MGMLQGKVAIITGASSGIGRATAMLFAGEGAALVLNARGKSSLEEVAEAIRGRGGSVHVVVGDVGQPDTHDELVADALRVLAGWTLLSTMQRRWAP